MKTIYRIRTASNTKTRKGVALIVAIGVLATLFLLVSMVSVTSRLMYDRSGFAVVRAQMELLTDNGAQRAMSVFQDKRIAEPTDMEYKPEGSEIHALLTSLSRDEGVYSNSGLEYRDGDVRAAITVHYTKKSGARYTATRQYLINLQGQRDNLVRISQIHFKKEVQ
jgi:hypothetical protein